MLSNFFQSLSDFLGLYDINRPEYVQKSKKDESIIIKNSQRIRKIANECFLIDLDDPLLDEILPSLSTEIAECLVIMVLEYPLTEQFRAEHILFSEVFQKIPSLGKATRPKFLRGLRKEGWASSHDFRMACIAIFDMLDGDYTICY